MIVNICREMKPPKSTKTAAYRWNKEMVMACQRIEQLHVAYLDQLHNEYEQVCKECLDRVENFQVGTNIITILNAPAIFPLLYKLV